MCGSPRPAPSHASAGNGGHRPARSRAARRRLWRERQVVTDTDDACGVVVGIPLRHRWAAAAPLRCRPGHVATAARPRRPRPGPCLPHHHVEAIPGRHKRLQNANGMLKSTQATSSLRHQHATARIDPAPRRDAREGRCSRRRGCYGAVSRGRPMGSHVPLSWHEAALPDTRSGFRLGDL